MPPRIILWEDHNNFINKVIVCFYCDITIIITSKIAFIPSCAIITHVNIGKSYLFQFCPKLI